MAGFTFATGVERFAYSSICVTNPFLLKLTLEVYVRSGVPAIVVGQRTVPTNQFTCYDRNFRVSPKGTKE
jgi:hypothetical protein